VGGWPSPGSFSGTVGRERAVNFETACFVLSRVNFSLPPFFLRQGAAVRACVLALLRRPTSQGFHKNKESALCLNHGPLTALLVGGRSRSRAGVLKVLPRQDLEQPSLDTFRSFGRGLTEALRESGQQI
jgi:hypothetical protein